MVSDTATTIAAEGTATLVINPLAAPAATAPIAAAPAPATNSAITTTMATVSARRRDEIRGARRRLGRRRQTLIHVETLGVEAAIPVARALAAAAAAAAAVPLCLEAGQ